MSLVGITPKDKLSSFAPGPTCTCMFRHRGANTVSAHVRRFINDLDTDEELEDSEEERKHDDPMDEGSSEEDNSSLDDEANCEDDGIDPSSSSKIGDFYYDRSKLSKEEIRDLSAIDGWEPETEYGDDVAVDFKPLPCSYNSSSKPSSFQESLARSRS